MILKKFSQNIFPTAYDLHGMKNAILTTTPKMIQQKNHKKVTWRSEKKIKKNCKNILLNGHLETNSAHMTTVLQFFSANPKTFSPTGGIFFKKPTMFSSKCSSGQVKCIFDDSVQKFCPSSKSFGSKCIFDDCWNISAGSSINFAWKTTLNWKTNTFLIKTPQKILGTLKMQFQQKWRNFFFQNYYFFRMSPKLKKHENHSQKNQKRTSDT